VTGWAKAEPAKLKTRLANPKPINPEILVGKGQIF
jgi:hypothetical protein